MRTIRRGRGSTVHCVPSPPPPPPGKKNLQCNNSGEIGAKFEQNSGDSGKCKSRKMANTDYNDFHFDTHFMIFVFSIHGNTMHNELRYTTWRNYWWWSWIHYLELYCRCQKEWKLKVIFMVTISSVPRAGGGGGLPSPVKKKNRSPALYMATFCPRVLDPMKMSPPPPPFPGSWIRYWSQQNIYTRDLTWNMHPQYNTCM